MKTTVRFGSAGLGLLLSTAGLIMLITNSATIGNDVREAAAGRSSKPSPAMGTVLMPFASLSGSSRAYPDGTVMMVGQSLVGDSANDDYRMCVGAIEGLVPLRPGDFNRDRRVSLEDWSQFADCFLGPDVPVGPECRQGDINLDDDVDLADVAAFQRLFDPGS